MIKKMLRGLLGLAAVVLALSGCATRQAVITASDAVKDAVVRDVLATVDNGIDKVLSVPERRQHVVRPGDTLWDLSAELTGDPYLWPALYKLNRDEVPDPDVIEPGQRLDYYMEYTPRDSEILRRAAYLYE